MTQTAEEVATEMLMPFIGKSHRRFNHYTKQTTAIIQRHDAEKDEQIADLKSRLEQVERLLLNDEEICILLQALTQDFYREEALENIVQKLDAISAYDKVKEPNE